MPGPLLRYRPIWIANTPARWSDQKTMTDENQTKRTFHPELLGLFSLLSWTSRLYVFDNCLRLNYKCLHIRLFRMVISWLWSSILYCIPLENSNFIVQHHKTNNCYFEYLRKCLVTIIVVIKCANIVLRKQKLDQQVAQCTVFNWSCNNRAFKKKNCQNILQTGSFLIFRYFNVLFYNVEVVHACSHHFTLITTLCKLMYHVTDGDLWIFFF